jgi:hypothetical protein
MRPVPVSFDLPLLPPFERLTRLVLQKEEHSGTLPNCIRNCRSQREIIAGSQLEHGKSGEEGNKSCN